MNIPSTGPIGILRLHVPVQQEPVELDWVELQGSDGKKRWEF